ncbi:MAG TPA: FlgD immunoglobulin-like domain containing protein [Candidatus Krumholzibacteria bacterium]|nr:FlgD immunoglobulin-like domain containing protein [Candidatus Krumholzibacteria bacterium]
MFDRMWMGSGKPTNGGFERPQSIAIGTAEQVVVVDRQLSSTWPLRIQIFGTETSVVTAELEAFTDDGVNPLAPNATLPASGCPEGDGDHLVVTVAIDPSEVAGPIPASALVLVLPSGGAAVSYAPVNADEDATLVNGMYRTTFTMRKFGGCQSSDVVVALNGVGIGSVPVVLRSPDWEAGGSDGAVNLGDFAWFGGHYTSPPKPYSECADHRAAYGAVNLGDFGHFGAHYAHTSGGGSLLSGTLPAADGTLRVELEESNPVVGERRLWARLVLEGVEPFKAMVVALRNEHPDLEYLGWTPSAAYANGTACIELTRGGVKQVFLGVMGTGGVSGGSVELGRVEFAIQGDEALTLTDEDLSFLNAELLSSADKVLAFSGLRLERTINAPSYEFELAQNYPNPFNPSTTIAYSLAQASDVELTIFDVRGSHVKTVVRERRDAGVHRAPWDGTDNRGNRVASGVYFYRLTAGSFRATKKMVLLR